MFYYEILTNNFGALIKEKIDLILSWKKKNSFRYIIALIELQCASSESAFFKSADSLFYEKVVELLLLNFLLDQSLHVEEQL